MDTIGEIAMKNLGFAFALVANLALMSTGTVQAQQRPGQTAGNACKGTDVLRRSKSGQMMCVNGKPGFNNCVVGGMQLGFSRSEAESFCGKRWPH